jgi:hypothetical protein
MRQSGGSLLTSNQEAWIKRYYEIHFDYSTEFKNTSVSIENAEIHMFVLMLKLPFSGNCAKETRKY